MKPFLGFVLTLTLAPSNIHAVDWPQAMEEYLRPSGNCENQKKSIHKTLENHDDYVVFQNEETCRLYKFKEAFLKSPDRFCPGMVLSDFSRCYGALLLSMSSAPGLDTVGHVMMHSIALEYLSKNRKNFKSKSLFTLQLSETSLENLRVFKNRVKADRFKQRFVNTRTATGKKAERIEIKDVDKETSARFAKDLIEKTEKSLNDVKRLISNEDDPSSSLEAKASADVHALEELKKSL